MNERLSLVALETAYLANMLAPRKDKRAWRVDDFMPEVRRNRGRQASDAPHRPKPKQSVEHMKSLLKGLAGALGGEIREHKPDSEEASD